MRMDIHAINMAIPSELREYAEIRMWQAVRRAARPVAWVGMWLVDHRDGLDPANLACRLDAWVRGIGIVTVRHWETDPCVAIDIAAARLEQAMAGQMRRLAPCHLRSGTTNAPRNGQPLPQPSALRSGPRLAVVIERGGLPRRLALVPWLKARHGVEQMSRISLPAKLWQAATAGSGLAQALRERLALSLLCRPQLIVVVGRTGAGDDSTAVQAERERVQQIVDQLRRWNIPVQTVGLWIAENWQPERDVESMELTRFIPDEVWTEYQNDNGVEETAGRLNEREVVSCG